MADSSEVSKWAGVGLAALSAFGGYVGSVSSKSSEEAVVKSQIAQVQVSIRDHDERERQFGEKVSDDISDLKSRVRVLESRK